MNHYDHHDALERSLADWIQHRKEQDSPNAAFTHAVMKRVHSRSKATPPPPHGDSAFSRPRPFLAALCLCAGIGKLALILHFAF